jgi:hypothetical protein
MSRNTVNLVRVFDAEVIGPDYTNFHFKFHFRGETPGGKDLDVIVEFPAYFVEALGTKLHHVLKEQERHLANSRRALTTGTIL